MELSELVLLWIDYSVNYAGIIDASLNPSEKHEKRATARL